MSTTWQARLSLTRKTRRNDTTAFRRSAGLRIFSEEEPQGLDVHVPLTQHPQELRILDLQMLQAPASETSRPPNFAFHR